MELVHQLTDDEISLSHCLVIPVNIVVETVVAAERDQRAKPQTIREKDLSRSIQPDLREQ